MNLCRTATLYPEPLRGAAVRRSLARPKADRQEYLSYKTLVDGKKENCVEQSNL
jgi:hypothetical protein